MTEESPLSSPLSEIAEAVETANTEVSEQVKKNPWLLWVIASIIVLLLIGTVLWFMKDKKNSVEIFDPTTIIGNILPFPDISKNHDNYTAISYLSRENILKAKENGKFNPDDTISQAEWAVTLVKLAGVDPDPDIYANCFTDVKDEIFASSVCYAKVQGWIKTNTSEISTQFFPLIFARPAAAQTETSPEQFGPRQTINNARAIGSLSRMMSWMPEDTPAGGGTDEQALRFAETSNIYIANEASGDLTRGEGAELIFRSLATVSLGQEQYSPTNNRAVQIRQLGQLIDTVASEEVTQATTNQQEFTRLKNAYIERFAFSIGKKAAEAVVENSSTEKEALKQVRQVRFQQTVASEQAAGTEAQPFNALLPLQNVFASKGRSIAPNDTLMFKSTAATDFSREQTNDLTITPRDGAQMYLFLDDNYRVISQSDWKNQPVRYYIDITLNTFYGEGWTDKSSGIGIVNMTLVDAETRVAQWSGTSAPANQDILDSPLTVSGLTKMYNTALRDIEQSIGQEILPAPYEREQSGYNPLVPNNINDIPNQNAFDSPGQDNIAGCVKYDKGSCTDIPGGIQSLEEFSEPAIAPAASTTYIDPRTIEYDRLLAERGGVSLDESRQRLIDLRLELYNSAPNLYSEYPSAAAYAKALGIAYDQALKTYPVSDGIGSPDTDDNSQLKARVDEVGSHVFDAPDPEDKNTPTTQSR